MLQLKGKNILMSTIFKKKYSRLDIVKKEYNLFDFKEGTICQGLQSIFMNMKSGISFLCGINN